MGLARALSGARRALQLPHSRRGRGRVEMAGTQASQQRPGGRLAPGERSPAAGPSPAALPGSAAAAPGGREGEAGGAARLTRRMEPPGEGGVMAAALRAAKRALRGELRQRLRALGAAEKQRQSRLLSGKVGAGRGPRAARRLPGRAGPGAGGGPMSRARPRPRAGKPAGDFPGSAGERSGDSRGPASSPAAAPAFPGLCAERDEGEPRLGLCLPPPPPSLLINVGDRGWRLRCVQRPQ